MENDPPKKESGLSGAKVAGIVVLAMLITMVATVFIVKSWALSQSV